MPIQHTVQPGECLSSIALRYGFFADAIWNHAANAPLRTRRVNMNVLAPGDVVVIPDKTLGLQTRPTGQRHRFRRRGVPAKFRFRLVHGDTPRAGVPFRLIVDGRTHEGATDSDGVGEIPVAPDARRARLYIDDPESPQEHDVALGQLRPADSIDGAQARLRNLGYEDVRVTGELDDATRSALRAFQAAQGLGVTGQLDAATSERLRTQHDST